jgi:hypothetical protein
VSREEITYDKKMNFDGLEIGSVVGEPSRQYRLFEIDLKDTQARQLKIFMELENGLTFLDGHTFGSQVHFQFASQTPVQRWYPYREGYSIGLVSAFIKELNITSNTFDPFAGSGTTLLASRINNLKSFGVDVNPISVLVAKVENEQYTKDDINTFRKEIENMKTLEKSEENFDTAFYLADRVFNKDILRSLLQFKYHIKAVENEKVRRLFFVAWLSIIEDVSNIKKEGNGIKYKNRRRTSTGYVNIEKAVWEQQNFPDNKFYFVKIKILRQLEVILGDLQSKYGRCERKPEIFLGSCLEFEEYFSDEIQFSFFSPPYCNCFDYFEIHKVELWLGDFVTSHKDLRSLRTSGFRSNTNALDNKVVTYKNEHLENLVGLFDSKTLWNKKIPSVVRGYFDDMHTLLNKIYQRTCPKGLVGIVIGNSAYSGVIIPTDLLITEIAREVGFKTKSVFLARHLTTSSQQKKELIPLRNYLRESIVLLEK